MGVDGVSIDEAARRTIVAAGACLGAGTLPAEDIASIKATVRGMKNPRRSRRWPIVTPESAFEEFARKVQG